MNKFMFNLDLRGPSTTIWTKFYPILTTYPPRLDILYTPYPFFTWPNVDFLLTTSLPLLVHVVIEWPFMMIQNCTVCMHKKLESMYAICFYAVTSYTDDVFCNNGNVRVCVTCGTSVWKTTFKDRWIMHKYNRWFAHNLKFNAPRRMYAFILFVISYFCRAVGRSKIPVGRV